MDKQTQLKIMTLISNRTPAAICRQFQREKWEWSDENVIFFITVSLAEKQKERAQAQITKKQDDTVSR